MKQTSININKRQQITQSCVAVKNNGCELFIKKFFFSSIIGAQQQAAYITEQS
jgi:hypothetical protein